MAKQTYNNPIDKNVNWGGDSNTGGLPVSGAIVQKFIKDTLASKFGYSRVVDGKEQFFEDEASASLYDENPTLNSKLLLQEIDLPSGGGDGMQYYVRAVNNLDTRNFATSIGKNCYIDFTFVSQYRDGSESSYENTGERGRAQLFVRASGSEYVLIREFYCNSNVSNKIEVSSLLISGENDVMIRIVGEETQQAAPALIYTITLTSLSLSANNFAWQTTFTENIVIPFNIGGNVNKNLFVTVTGDDYIARYEASLGKTTYLETAYNYTIPHPGKAGVFNIAAYVQNSEGTITTDTIQFSVVCSVAGDTSKFITINNIASKATNWSDNKLFSYSVYDGGNATTSLTFRVEKSGTVISESTNGAIVTEKVNTFNLPLEIETIDNKNFTIVVYISDENGVLETIEFLVDNSLGYSASSGATLYINPKTRSNTQSNRELIVNEMDGSEIQTTWTNVGWGADGWTAGASGNKILRLISGSTATVNYQPFYIEPARTGKTIEMDFSINNVSDYETMVINMSSGGTSPIGIQIYPEEVAMYSQILKTKDVQNVNLKDNDRIKMSIVLMPDAYGNPNFNLAIIYINGVKNREFTYESNDYFQNAGKIVLGCTGSDLDIYGMRVYDFALTTAGVLRNLINWETSTEKREDITYRNDVLDVDGYEVDYNKVQPKFNVFVWEGEVPSLSNPNDFTGNLRVLWKDNPSWNSYVKNVTCGGQGTSSMKYWMWNLRWKVGSSTTVEYNDGSSTTGSWQFVPGQPAIKRGTAKLNWASSMQSHKMGSVNSINDLAEELGIVNEANARIAIYQYPFVGFQKTVNEDGEDVYKFIGLYTFGPDKGDDNTFGYDTSKYPNLLSLEGSDNAPLPALFRVPWNKSTGRIVYNSTEEAFQYNGVNCWDFNAGDLDKIDPWINAYNFVYECSPRLQAYEGSLSQLNSNKATYKDVPNEFWLTNGDVVYYEPSVGEFIYSDTGNGTINLNTQLVDKGYGLTSSDLTGKTAAEKTQLFIKARIEKFRLEMQQYWNLDDAIFQRNWVEFNAATDNRAKNTYPYTFGGTFRWRSDDTDTIGPITNQGQSKKGYHVEIGDSYENGQPVWNGETSNFWNLIDLAFADEVVLGMKNMMTAMENLSGKLTGTSVEKIYAFYKKYYFDMAQEYFSETLYNMAAKTLYESAKIAYNNGTYTNDTDPITQSLGDHYAAERRWFSKRIPYMMSKYSYGEFSADGTDNITVRAAGNTITYELTPATYMYPTIINGTSVVRGVRTEPGETCVMEVELGGSADQQNIIQGASYLQDIGTWYNKNVTGDMIVKGRMLSELNLGHKSNTITISIDSLTVADCPSLQTILLSRISTLSGTLDVSKCLRLEEIHMDGTSIVQALLPAGGNLKKVLYSNSNKYINLRNLPLLTSANVTYSGCKTQVTDFLVSDCPQLNPITMLYDIWSSQSSQSPKNLKRVRCVNFDVTADNKAIEMLYEMSEGDYTGLDSEGVATTGLPIFEGKLHVSGAVKKVVDELKVRYPRLKITYDSEIVPSGYTLKFTSKTSFKEYEVPENGQIQLAVTSSNSAYSDVVWAVYNYSSFTSSTATLDQNGLLTLSGLPSRDSNTTWSKTITIQASSAFNNTIYVRSTISISATKITGISLSGLDTEYRFGDTDQLTVTVSPNNHTKIDWLPTISVSLDDCLEIDENYNLSVISEETHTITVTASIAGYNSSQSTLINDKPIATSESNPEFMRLMYLNGKCASPEEMYAAEAMKITSDCGSIFNNNSVITSLKEFKYFEKMPVFKLSGCSNLSELELPVTLSTLQLTNLPLLTKDNLIIPSGVRYFGFSKMTGFNEIPFPENTYQIDLCSDAPETVVIPNNVYRVDDWQAFADSPRLITLNLGSSNCTWLQSKHFSNCPNIKYIYGGENQTNLDGDEFGTHLSLEYFEPVHYIMFNPDMQYKAMFGAWVNARRCDTIKTVNGETVSSNYTTLIKTDEDYIDVVLSDGYYFSDMTSQKRMYVNGKNRLINTPLDVCYRTIHIACNQFDSGSVNIKYYNVLLEQTVTQNINLNEDVILPMGSSSTSSSDLTCYITYVAEENSGYIDTTSLIYISGYNGYNKRDFYVNEETTIKIQHVNGTLYTTEEWTTNGFTNDDANGVASTSLSANFVIAKEDAGTSLKWGGYGKNLTNIVTGTSSSTVVLDFDGKGNTTKIINQLTGFTDSQSVTGAPAAEACANYTFPNGSKGYLPSAGEWQLVLNNINVITRALSLIGAQSFSYDNYWSSSQGDSYNAYSMYYSTLSVWLSSKANSYRARAFGSL